MSCKYCNGRGIPYGDKTQEFCVFENHGHPEIVIPLNANASVSANIDFCPKCGRNLKKIETATEYNRYEFPHHLEIPVPIGGTVWSFWTDCCCACYTKKDRPDELRCDFQAPCHTYVTSIKPVVLSYHNLGMILEQWGKRYFYTKSDAEDAAHELVTKHKARMRELGYDIDNKGKIVNFESELKDYE